MASNYGNGPKSMSTVMIEQRGPLSQLELGLLWQQHIDQLKDGVNISPESAPTGGLSSQTSTEESSIEDKDAPETPTTITDSRPAENVNVGEPS